MSLGKDSEAAASSQGPGQMGGKGGESVLISQKRPHCLLESALSQTPELVDATEQGRDVWIKQDLCVSATSGPQMGLTLDPPLLISRPVPSPAGVGSAAAPSPCMTETKWGLGLLFRCLG